MSAVILSPFYLLAMAGAVLAFRLSAPYVGRTARPLVLALISVCFLWQFLSLRTYMLFFVGFLAVVLALASIIRRTNQKNRRKFMLLGITAIVTVMLLFKYPNFLNSVINLPNSLATLSAIEWIGLSYLSFRAVDLLLIARSPLTKSFNLADGLAYLTYFVPTIAGPINRFARFAEDMAAPITPLTRDMLRHVAFRFSFGVVKIVVLSRLMWYYSLPNIQHDLLDISSFDALIGLYAYFIYIYFEFSGYTDIVICISLLFGVRLPENFNQPIIARNIQDFWNRWHISLSQWCRDHIFFNFVRQVSIRLPHVPVLITSAVGIVITFLFIGTWHGDALNWVLYGLYHGAGLSIWMIWREVLPRLSSTFAEKWDESTAARVFATFLTFNFVVWGMVLSLPLQQARQFLAIVLL